MQTNLPIDWKPAALKSLHAVGEKLRRSITNGVARYLQTGHGKVCRLREAHHLYRLKVGDYRILLQKEGTHVAVVEVLPRKNAYRDLKSI